MLLFSVILLIVLEMGLKYVQGVGLGELFEGIDGRIGQGGCLG